MENVYWTEMEVGNWRFYLAATDKGVCYISSPNREFDELENWVTRKISQAELVKDSDKLESSVLEVSEYLLGIRRTFTMPFDLRGTEFQLKVWEASSAIPYGETRTYSDIAEELSNPKAVRAVGAAIGKNPILFAIPCHRIVTKDGSLSGFRAGIDVKKELLELEKGNRK